MPRLASWILVMFLVEGASRPGEAAPPSAVDSAAAPRSLVSSRDLWFGLAASAGIVATFQADPRVREKALESRSRMRGLAKAAEHLGNPLYVGSALALVYFSAGRLGHREAQVAADHIGGAILAAGLACEVLKVAVGRPRPEQDAGEHDRARPFSSFNSFPSGHATVAFAAAAALDHESRAAWVPWVAYPLAGLVGWSRVHDDRHWASDVVAGAALGTWVGAKASILEDRIAARHAGLHLTLTPLGRGLGAGLQTRF